MLQISHPMRPRTILLMLFTPPPMPPPLPAGRRVHRQLAARQISRICGGRRGSDQRWRRIGLCLSVRRGQRVDRRPGGAGGGVRAGLLRRRRRGRRFCARLVDLHQPRPSRLPHDQQGTRARDRCVRHGSVWGRRRFRVRLGRGVNARDRPLPAFRLLQWWRGRHHHRRIELGVVRRLRVTAACHFLALLVWLRCGVLPVSLPCVTSARVCLWGT